jgi:hypothetical protein
MVDNQRGSAEHASKDALECVKEGKADIPVGVVSAAETVREHVLMPLGDGRWISARVRSKQQSAVGRDLVKGK